MCERVEAEDGEEAGTGSGIITLYCIKSLGGSDASIDGYVVMG